MDSVSGRALRYRAGAGTAMLAMLMLIGCQGTQSPSATPIESPLRSPSESVGPSAVSSVFPSKAPSPSEPLSPYPTPSLGMETVQTFGDITNGDGQALDGVVVHVVSLSRSSPYDATVVAPSGHYEVSGILLGVLLRFEASKAGYTSRTRVISLLPLGGPYGPINFGAQSNWDYDGYNYALYDQPEIASATAVPSPNASGTSLVVTLGVSEPLDTAQQSRFAQLVRVFPANETAAPDASGATDLNQQATATGYPAQTTHDPSGLYALVPSQVSWSGTSCRLDFDAPMQTSANASAAYQIVLADDGGQPVTDPSGLALGMNTSGAWKTGNSGIRDFAFLTWPKARSPKGLKAPDGTSIADAAQATWILTHENAWPFVLPPDTLEPTLTAFTASNMETGASLTLHFSRVLNAFNGTDTGHLNAHLLDLSNCLLAIATNTADLGAINWNAPPALPPTLREAPLGKPFELRSQAASLTFDPHFPTNLTLSTKTPFASDVTAIAVKMASGADAAGHSLAGLSAQTTIR